MRFLSKHPVRDTYGATALRPQLVTGPTPGALNVLPAIGVYAAIRREKAEAFGFPGGPSFVWEAADADLVAEVMVWAAQSAQAGFTKTIDTEDSFRNALQSLIDHKLLPPAVR
jgi:hypothetical protein